MIRVARDLPQQTYPCPISSDWREFQNLAPIETAQEFWPSAFCGRASVALSEATLYEGPVNVMQLLSPRPHRISTHRRFRLTCHARARLLMPIHLIPDTSHMI